MSIEEKIPLSKDKKDLYKGIRTTTFNLFKKLKKSKNKPASELHKITQEIRNLVERHEEAFHIVPKEYPLNLEYIDALLNDLEPIIEKRYRHELEEELSDEAKPHLLKLINALDAEEQDNDEIIKHSKSLIDEVSEQNPLEKLEAGYIPIQHINRSKKVLAYLKLVHDIMEIEEKEHIAEFDKLIQTSTKK